MRTRVAHTRVPTRTPRDIVAPDRVARYTLNRMIFQLLCSHYNLHTQGVRNKRIRAVVKINIALKVVR